MSVDFLESSQGDFTLALVGVATNSTPQAVNLAGAQQLAQTLSIGLRMYQDDWYLGTNDTTPVDWHTYMSQQNPGITIIDSAVQDNILANGEVKGIVSFSSSFTNGQYTITNLIIDSIWGTVVVTNEGA